MRKMTNILLDAVEVTLDLVGLYSFLIFELFCLETINVQWPNIFLNVL